MDIISAYREVGTYRGAAEIVRHDAQDGETGRRTAEAGGAAPRGRRGPTITTRWPSWSPSGSRSRQGRISAKRLLPIARAAGYDGSARNFRRLVAEQKRCGAGSITGSPPGGVVTG